MSQATSSWTHHAYSWHQSHDQATVLLTVTSDVTEQDIEIKLEREYIVAGIRGQVPIVKGKLYGPVDPVTSVWQLEPRSDDRPLRDRQRTASVASTVSSRSSYAYVSSASDQDISSSLAASMEHINTSDWDHPPSTSYSSPFSSPRVPASGDEQFTATGSISRTSSGHSPSPLFAGVPASYASSLDSLHGTGSERLLTLHLEKAESAIWPSLVCGPVPLRMSPAPAGPFSIDQDAEAQYNMDPTSLTLMGLDIYDIRKNKELAFGYFARAWRQAHVPTAALRLVTHYVPPQSTAARPVYASVSALSALEPPIHGPLPVHGSADLYVHSLGGSHSLAQLYLEAGLLHLDGLAPALLAASASSRSLASLRLPAADLSVHSALQLSGALDSVGVEQRRLAASLFNRARELWPQLDVPVLPLENDSSDTILPDLQMPSVNESTELSGSLSEDETVMNPRPPANTIRRGRAGTAMQASRSAGVEKEQKNEKSGAPRTRLQSQNDSGHPWYLYAPGVVGAGTALAAVAVVGALSFSTWKRGQN